jgi:hypothetical protein
VFDGLSAFLAGASQTWNIGTAFGVSLWFSGGVAASGSALPIFTIRGLSNETLQVDWTSDGVRGLVWGADGNLEYAQKLDIGADTGLHHIAWTGDATDCRLYVDGLEVATAAGIPTGTVRNDATYGQIGALSDPGSAFIGDFFTGLVDEVGLWKGTKLTAANVTALYNGGAGARP